MGRIFEEKKTRKYCSTPEYTMSQAGAPERDDVRRLVNEAHKPRAADMASLQALQKTQKEFVLASRPR
jgi:hypothetical protein